MAGSGAIRVATMASVAGALTVALGGCGATGDAVISQPSQTAPGNAAAPSAEPTLQSGSTCEPTYWNPWNFRTCTYVNGGGFWVNYVNVNADRPDPFPRGHGCHAKAHVWQNGTVNLNGDNKHCDWWRDGNTETFPLNRNVSPGLLCGALIFFDGSISKAACVNVEADGSIVPAPGQGPPAQLGSKLS